jgi:hypothetical protein
VNGALYERIFTTTDMRLAVILLIFGSKLRRCLPLEWTDIYSSVDAYLENLEYPLQQKPKTRIIFNFELVNLPEQLAKEIRDGKDLAIIISELIDQDGRDALLAARQHLYDLITLARDERPDAQWDLIKGSGAGELVTFGKRADLELQAEFLGKL